MTQSRDCRNENRNSPSCKCCAAGVFQFQKITRKNNSIACFRLAIDGRQLFSIYYDKQCMWCCLSFAWRCFGIAYKAEQVREKCANSLHFIIVVFNTTQSIISISKFLTLIHSINKYHCTAISHDCNNNVPFLGLNFSEMAQKKFTCSLEFVVRQPIFNSTVLKSAILFISTQLMECKKWERKKKTNCYEKVCINDNASCSQAKMK